MTKPTLTQRKDKEAAVGLETPIKHNEVTILFSGERTRTLSTGLPHHDGAFHFAWNNPYCRLLIFWTVITTLSSVISIYYAIDAQNRLNEATDSLRFQG